MKRFRLDRGAALAASGVNVLAAAVLVVPGLWWREEDGVLGAVGQVAAILAVLAIAAAAWFALRPPVVLRMDDDAYHSRVRFSTGRFAGRWADVDDAEVADGHLVLATKEGQQAFPLRLVGDRRVQMLHEISERLNAANGYRRWLG